MIIKPVIPAFADHLAHNYWPQQHYKIVHAHNGIFHVDEEVKKANNEESQKDKTSGKIKTEVSEDFCITPVLHFPIASFFFLEKIYPVYIPFSSSVIPEPDYQPPRC